MTRYDDLPLYEPERPRQGWSDGRKRRFRRTIAWVAFGLVAVLLLGGGYVAYNYFHFSNGISRLGGVIPGNNGADKDGKAQNILLIGNDARPAGVPQSVLNSLHAGTAADGGLNTDTMIIVHLPADGSSATMISFPRDSWVSIPGHGKNKLNAAYGLAYNAQPASATQKQRDAAGARELIETLQNVTGLTIDHYVRVSLLGFYNIAKALGPIQVCLNENTSDPTYSGANFTKGENTLSAEQAVAFVRQRHGLPGGDFDRETRQQYFLSVEAQKMLSAGTLLNPVKLNNALSAVSGSLQTDSGLNLLSLAGQMNKLKGGNIASATIPLANPSTSYVWSGGSQLSVVNLDYAAIPDFIDTVTGQPTAAQRVAAAKAADPASVTVNVLNGAGTARGSSTALATYKSLGFKTGSPKDAPAKQQVTTIYFPAGNESSAKTVSKYLPGAALAQSADYKNVTVVLGTDGKMPAANPQSGSAQQAPSQQAPAHGSAPSTAAPSAPAKNYNKTTCIN
jgi:LCP family protein required for cell wall assembly